MAGLYVHSLGICNLVATTLEYICVVIEKVSVPVLYVLALCIDQHPKHKSTRYSLFIYQNPTHQ